MAGDARQQALLRPAPVAIHDDGDVARNGAHIGNGFGGAGEHVGPCRAALAAVIDRLGTAAKAALLVSQTAIKSASLACSSLSISAM